uniref:Uncharacterized protein n=1 Tax=Panagrolaimus sp. ES5 TaxID=591445 RepID=A0AC34F0J0_9BILA
RLTPLQTCAHPFLDELRNPATKLPSGKALPPLFDFTLQELSIEPALNRVLIPGYTGTLPLISGATEASGNNSLTGSVSQKEKESGNDTDRTQE